MIKFVYEEEGEKELTLADVEENQFFVDIDDSLSQKLSDESYIIIADDTGAPCAQYYENIDPDEPIKRILPRVEKIKF